MMLAVAEEIREERALANTFKAGPASKSKTSKRASSMNPTPRLSPGGLISMNDSSWEDIEKQPNDTSPESSDVNMDSGEDTIVASVKSQLASRGDHRHRSRSSSSAPSSEAASKSEDDGVTSRTSDSASSSGTADFEDSNMSEADAPPGSSDCEGDDARTDSESSGEKEVVLDTRRKFQKQRDANIAFLKAEMHRLELAQLSAALEVDPQKSTKKPAKPRVKARPVARSVVPPSPVRTRSRREYQTSDMDAIPIVDIEFPSSSPFKPPRIRRKASVFRIISDDIC
jgi:hypothetical protein